MPAHVRALATKCRVCGARATVEVFDRWNGSYGPHCKRCGNAKVKELNKEKA